MPHPALGLPPADATAGNPALAKRLRGAADRLPAQSLHAALRIDPTLGDRHDELMLRRFLRDYEQHIKQLVDALASGDDRHVTVYGETLVPIYRHRRVRMNDVVSLLRGLEAASASVVPNADAAPLHETMDAWVERMRHHRRLAGDHQGDRAARFLWKGAGLGDDTVV